MEVKTLLVISVISALIIAAAFLGYYQSVKDKIITKEVVDLIFSGQATETTRNLYIGDIITYIIEKNIRSGGGGSGETGGFSDECNPDESLENLSKSMAVQLFH